MDITLSLSAQQDKKNFRLLELPPELLQALLADATAGLELKSASRDDLPGDRPADVVLCSPTTTWKVRQKNSSNSVWLLQPSHYTNIGGVTAIAQCHSSLELSKQSDQQAIQYLRDLIPLYSSTGTISTGNGLTVRQAFDLVPCSERQCVAAATELALTLNPDTGQLLRPSAQVKIDAWRHILDAALCDGTAIEQLDSETALQGLSSARSTLESAIAQAVLKAVGIGSQTARESSDPKQQVRWIGATLLEAIALHAPTPLQGFLGTWKDLLPEVWRSQADPALLNSIAILEDGGKSIKCDQRSLAGMDEGSGGTSSLASASSNQKRKWHEKFRPANR